MRMNLAGRNFPVSTTNPMEVASRIVRVVEERRVQHGTRLPADKSACRRILRPCEKCTGSA